MIGPLRIGIAGLGTVGLGVLEILNANNAEISERSGRKIIVTAVSARDKTKDRNVNLETFKWLDNATQLADQDDVDIILELIGGSDGIAKELTESSLSNRKHVVTANKALIAHHGTALAEIAEKNGVCLSFEAAVAGGIPIVKALRDGLAANKIKRLYGIMNGTCNYILTSMAKSGRAFQEVLDEAKLLGYAEILNNKIYQRVHPTLIRNSSYVATIDGVLNAVIVDGKPIGQTIIQGEGAGPSATTSALVSDISSVLRGNIKFPFSLSEKERKKLKFDNISNRYFSAYLRFEVLDRPGVLSNITNVFSKNKVSIKRLVHGLIF